MNKSNTLSESKILLLALSTGIVVANLNYIQPLLGIIAVDMQTSTHTVGLVATLTQIGYALGLLFLVPLGDIYNRNRLIQIVLFSTIVSLFMAYFASNIYTFSFASFFVGVSSIAPQIIIPFTSFLSEPEQRGQVLGRVMGGLLTGLLLSRSLSGLLASIFPWQTIYLIAAIMVIILLLILHWHLPKDTRKKQNVNYYTILFSMPKLLFSEKHLKGSAINGFTLFGASNVFWSTLSFFVSQNYHWGSNAVGLLSLLGITGIIFAPIVGRLVDTRSPRWTIKLGIIFSSLSFILFFGIGKSLIGLIIGIILLDLGTQFGQVSNQAIVQSLNTSYGSRYNSIFMFSYFVGGASGTWIGTTLWSLFGWEGVCLSGSLFLICSIFSHLILPEPIKLNNTLD